MRKSNHSSSMLPLWRATLHFARQYCIIACRGHVVVIGAGPGGSTAAILLAKRGYRVDVYERRPQPKQDPIDLKRTYIIALSERGLKPMRAAGVSIPSDAPYKGFVRHLKGGKVQVTQQCHATSTYTLLHRVSLHLELGHKLMCNSVYDVTA